MLDECCIPAITTAFDNQNDDGVNVVYHNAIRKILQKILPLEFFIIKEADADFLADQREYFHATLPIIKVQMFQEESGTILSFYALYKYRPNAFKFFFEMVIHWLVPGKRLNAFMVYAVDFRMPEISNDLYTLCEVKVQVDNPDELREIEKNLPIVESEMKLGVESNYYARRILEIKGVTPDKKTTMVQEYIASLVKRRPLHFDHDVMNETQHILVICRDDFKDARPARHLSRIICVHYLFRKRLKEAVKLSPGKRHLFLKIFRTKLRSHNKCTLGIIVGVNFLKEQEIFEKKHLLTAIQNYIPSVQAVEDSFFAIRRGAEHLCTLYIEIEKKTGDKFSDHEIQLLRKELPADLKDRIEHLMHPIFMPRNEEEIMRNILSLSNQIKYVRDIPQVAISFDEQRQTNLFFTVILVRVLKPGAASIQEMFRNAKSVLHYMHERCKPVGYLRKKYVKEANVFRIKIPKEHFLRKDHSIDLFKARQYVIAEMSKVVGEVRDYNGGIISKQNELLGMIRDMLGSSIKYNELLLESFFYSLLPVAMRSVMDPGALKNLFLMQVESIEKGFFNTEGYSLSLSHDKGYVYVMIKAKNRAIKEELSRSFAKLQIPPADLANTYVKVYETPYIGYIYRCDDPIRQALFCDSVRESLHSYSQRE